MKKAFYLAAALCAVGAPSANAQVMLDMSLITCRQALDSPPERLELITSWLAGYFSASKNLSSIDFRYLERNQRVVTAHCKKNPRETLMSAIQKVAR
jgi:acid stress chaperone HdeB